MEIDDRSTQRGRAERALSIGALARATGIPVETLRTWERRYGAPKPVRKPSGHRVYPVAMVEHLRRVSRLLESGHRPGEILGLTQRELEALLALTADAPSGDRPGALAGAAFSPAATVRALLRATVELDRAALLHELRFAWVRLGPVRFLDEVAGAFMVEVGHAWSAKRLEVGHEHFASACLSDFLRSAREPFDHGARGPRVIAAMLPSEAHEGGLLIATCLLAHRGYRVLYLGADTPVDQIAAAARAARAGLVAVSVSAAMPRARATRELAGLRDALPRKVTVWVGGAGAPPDVSGVERFETLTALDARLTTSADVDPSSP